MADLLLAELFEITGSTPRAPLARHAHRWRFAKSTGLDIGPLWNPTLRLGVCGDWLLTPRVESAWLSGHHLAEIMTRDLAGRMDGDAA